MSAGCRSPREATHAARALVLADLTGTFVFALQGSLAAVGAGLDVVGILVLAFATAAGGGIVRDLLLGDVPPLAVRDARYAAVSFAAALLVLLLYVQVHRVPALAIVALDAGGLALFAVVGTAKAVDRGMAPLLAVLLGTISGVGGGVLRDVLLARVPVILHADVYASAAACGAVLMLLAMRLGIPRPGAALLGGVSCFALRIIAFTQHWQLPRVAVP